MQTAVKELLTRRALGLLPILHKSLHNSNGNRKTLKGNQIIVLTAESAERIFEAVANQ
jgi:hypothetical protein